MTLSVVGNVSERIGSSLEWKIPNWKSWMNRTYDLAQSPSFEFRDATWVLEMMYVQHLGHLNLYVVRKTCEQDNQVVAFKLMLRNSDGREGKIAGDQFEFTKDNNQYKCHITEQFAHNWSSDGSLTITLVLYKNRTIATAGRQSKSSECTDELTGDSGKNGDVISVDGKGNPEDYEKLSAEFKDLLLSDRGSDVTLKVQSREFKVHKAILRARSKVFDTMFAHTNGNSSDIISISDCEPKAFEDLLLYMYCGDVENISTNNVFGLYEASDKYDVVKLKEKCVQFMMDNLSVETFCNVLTKALPHRESEFIQKAVLFFANNEKEIIETEQWLSFLNDHPVEANELHIKAVAKRNSY